MRSRKTICMYFYIIYFSTEGLCQNCYINKYNQKRRTNEKIEEKEEEPDN